MTKDEAFSIHVRKAEHDYIWFAHYTDARRVTREIDHGYRDTQNAAWLAGIKAVKAFQRDMKKETTNG